VTPNLPAGKATAADAPTPVRATSAEVPAST
jgi:hypothetical protein